MTVAFDSNVDVTVEMAFGDGPLETPTWVDVSAYVRGIETIRGKSWVLDEGQAGEMEITLKNSDSRFEPLNTSGAYYPDVRLLTPVRFRAVYSSVTYDIWRGFVKSWPQQTRHNLYGDVVATCVDAFHILAMLEEEITESAEVSGTRIGNLLDRAGWPAGWRNLDAGSHNAQALSAEWNATLGEIQRAETVEQGLFYIAGDGDATFKDGNTRIEDATIQAIFSDDGSDIAWVGDDGIEPILDGGQTWNSAEVTRTGGTTQTSTDATSITAYGERTLSLSETLHVADGEAQALADWIVAENKDPKTRVRVVRVEPQGDPTDRWADCLGLELWDKVTVERTPSTSSSTISQDYFIQGIEHSVKVKQSGDTDSAWWETKFVLSPDLAFDDYWILGTSELGVSTRLGY